MEFVGIDILCKKDHRHINNFGLVILSEYYTYDSLGVVKKCKANAFKIKDQTEENQWPLLLEKY